MAKIEMTMTEYEELASYKRAFEDIMSPQIDDYDIKYYEEHPMYDMDVRSRNFEHLHPNTQKLIKEYIFSNIPDKIRGIGNINMDRFYLTLFRVVHNEEVESDEK